MLITPRLEEFNSSVDASQSITFNFKAIGGDMIYANEIEIYLTSTNQLIYSKKITTFTLKHQLESGVLSNSNNYKARIKTYNNSNQYSNWSDWLIFSCYSNATIVFSNIGSTITNQTYIFQARYNQSQSIPLKHYKFLLYDDNRTLMFSSDTMLQSTSEIEHEVTNFENAKIYYVEIIATNSLNAVSTTGLNQIYVEYSKVSNGKVLETTNNHLDASVDLKMKVVDVRFEVKNGSIEFADNQKLRLLNSCIYTDESLGFKLSDDWSMVLNFSVFENDCNIFKIIGADNGYLLFSKIGDRLFLRYYDCDNYMLMNTWFNIENVILDDEITLAIQKSGISFSKDIKIKYNERINLSSTDDKNILTSRGKEILISRKLVNK